MMKTWTLDEVKERFTDMIRACVEEPQLVYEHNQPVAVLMDIALFRELMQLRQQQKRPTIAELLTELSEIQDSIELEIPERLDRANPLLTALDETEQIIQSLIEAGELTPPPGVSDVEPVSEEETRELANVLGKAIVKPLSEIIIEDRGE